MRGPTSTKELVAIALAVIAFVVAIVVAGGIAFGGWLSTSNAGMSSSATEDNVAESAEAHENSSSENTNATATQSATPSEVASNVTSPQGEASGSLGSQAENSASASTAPSSSTPAQGGTSNVDTPSTQTITAYISVDSSKAHAKNASYPESMGAGNVTLDDGSSVFDALKALGVTIGGNSSYVSSINGLSQFDCGQQSGWMYRVNGEFAKTSCGNYKLHGGEIIEWIYVIEYTDVGF